MKPNLLPAGALATLLMLVGCGGAPAPVSTPASTAAPRTQPLTDVSYGMSSADSATILAQEAAKRKGFFANHGLNVELVQIQGGPATIAAIQSSSVAAGIISSPLLFNAVSQGAPILGVSLQTQGFAMQVTASTKVFRERNMSPAASTAVLLDYVKGLKVGTQPPGATSTVVFQGLLKANDKPPDWTTLVSAGTNNAALAGLQNGIFDVIVGGSPTGELAEAGGYGKLIWNSLSIDQFRTVAYGVTSVNPTYAEAHPRMVEGIVAALDDSQKWILANPDQAVELAATLFPTLPRDQLPAILKDTNFAPTARITDESMKSAQSLSNTFNLTPKPVPDDIVARSYTGKYFKA